MGTRGLLGFIIKGRRKGTYNHYDSYPTGLGDLIVKFLLSLSPKELQSMAERVENIVWVTEDEPPSKEMQEEYSGKGFANVDVGKQQLDTWYCLLRECQGAKALPLICTGELQHIVDDTNFAKQSLFCEWAYFIDFEKRVLETWRGFQNQVSPDNPFGQEMKDGYGPIAMVNTTPFDQLSSSLMDGMEQQCR